MKNQLLKYSFWVLFGIYLISASSYSATERANSVCTKIKVEILDEKKLISPSYIANLVTTNYTNAIGSPIAAINIHEVEQFIADYPAVKTVQSYTSLSHDKSFEGSILNIQLTQKEPIARIFCNDFNFYLDENSEIIPRDIEPTRVMVFTGAITNNLIQNEVVHLARYIHQDSLFRSLVDQVQVDEQKEYKIFTKFDRQYINFGTFEGYKSKLYRLKRFYQNAKLNLNFSKYKSLDVRFSDQVVCTKH